MAPSSNHSCAACKTLRRRCGPECTMAPYFPSDQTEKFGLVHTIYGASKVINMLNGRAPSERRATANSLIFEAKMRHVNPVYGSCSIIAGLRRQVSNLEAELAMANAEYLKLYRLHHQLLSSCTNNHHQHFPIGYGGHGQNVAVAGVASTSGYGGGLGVEAPMVAPAARDEWGRKMYAP